ncbi:heat shock factor-binding protein 1-like protein 1 isoform X1 [Turdus rufiventris]|nr:heat shock factor-binding protein 1-like protein 1 isoform X1 [Turdus rufiventris]
MAAAVPPGAVELPQLAENLLCRLQENFQALTEKLTLRNILFGAWGTRGWIWDPVAGAPCALMEMGERINDLEKRVADLMTEAGVENSNEELGVKTFT